MSEPPGNSLEGVQGERVAEDAVVDLLRRHGHEASAAERSIDA